MAKAVMQEFYNIEGKALREAAALFQEHSQSNIHIHTWKLSSITSLICWPPSSSTGAVG